MNVSEFIKAREELQARERQLTEQIEKLRVERKHLRGALGLPQYHYSVANSKDNPKLSATGMMEFIRERLAKGPATPTQIREGFYINVDEFTSAERRSATNRVHCTLNLLRERGEITKNGHRHGRDNLWQKNT